MLVHCPKNLDFTVFQKVSLSNLIFRKTGVHGDYGAGGKGSYRHSNRQRSLPLGRNRLIVGQLLEEGFDSLGVRYIAIMDNIDTAKGISDLVPMQDLFNEWHAKNTSQKVRNVFKSKGMSGAPLTTNPPFGYQKDPEIKNGWIIDEAAAKTVRQIFTWCIDGLGPTQIAKRLKVAKVPTPTEHWGNIGRNCSKPPAVPYNWCSATVADILGKQECTEIP